MMGRQSGDQSQLFYLFKALRKVRFSEGLPCPATSLAVRPNFPTQQGSRNQRRPRAIDATRSAKRAARATSRSYGEGPWIKAGIARSLRPVST